jgi:hypothetical protein
MLHQTFYPANETTEDDLRTGLHCLNQRKLTPALSENCKDHHLLQQGESLIGARQWRVGITIALRRLMSRAE